MGTNKRPYPPLERRQRFASELRLALRYGMAGRGTFRGVARSLGLSERTLYAWANGRATPSPEQARQIAREIGIPDVWEAP